MFKTKSEVDRHVHNCLKKINSEKERTLRCFSFAKLYFNVGDYDQAYRYVSSYLTIKPKSAEGYQLLGKSLEKLGKLDAALEGYRNSLQFDPKQNNLVIKVCELLSSDNVELDLSGARYFCDLAQSFDPNNRALHSLQERLITMGNENPQEVSQLLLKELETRPADVRLRVRLLKHFIHNNMIREAYKHASAIEEKDIDMFHNSINWYENFAEVLLRFQKDVSLDSDLSWEFWMLSVSVLERLVSLSLDDRHNIKGSTDYLTAAFNFDQTLHAASKRIGGCSDRQLVSTFLTHYHAQLQFHLATLLYKQVKRDIKQFREASNIVLPTLFISYHSSPPDLQSIWYIQSTDKIKKLVHRWYKAACFRCSQAGRILVSIAKDNKSSLLERATHYSTGIWREQMYKKIFVKRDQQLKMSTSYFVVNNPPLEPTISLPLPLDLIKYDEIAQLSFPDSLHHYVWIALNGNISDLNVITFEGMQFSTKNMTNCSAESLNLLDVYAFVCCATLCAKFKTKDNKLTYYNLLPASITESLCTIQQNSFLEAAYKMYKNEPSSHSGDIRMMLIKGIETVRCVGHHGLDLTVLVNLAKIFDERSKKLTKQSEIDFTIARAELYWKTALPLLDKIKNDQKITYSNNRLFELKSDEISPSEARTFIEKGKLFVGVQLMRNKEFDRALEVFDKLKDPYASFHQFEIYKRFVDRQIGEKNVGNISDGNGDDVAASLSKARDCLYLTLDRLRDPSVASSHPLNDRLGAEIENVERMLSDAEEARSEATLDVSIGDHYLSSLTHVSHTGFASKLNQSTPLRSSVRQEARPSPERLDAQIRQMMSSRDAVFALVSEQNRHVVDAQKNLMDKLNAVVDDLKSIKKDVERLKDVAASVEEIKCSVDDFQNVVDVVQEMKKELVEFKKNDDKHQLSDEDLFVLEQEYGVDYNAASNVNPFPPNVPGPFPTSYPTARLPNPAHMASAYAPPMLYPGLYPGFPYGYGGFNLTQPGPLPFMQEQQPTMPPLLAGHAPLAHNFGLEALSGQPLSHSVSQPAQLPKELPKDPTANHHKLNSSSSSSTPLNPLFGKAPVNVVITTSDPLPTENTFTSQPVLSVTIPPQHIKSNFSKPNASGSSIFTGISVPVTSTAKFLPEKEAKPNETINVSVESPQEYEPNVDFKPMFPLPDQVAVNTGEENEIELFCVRAKLFKHVGEKDAKEWKEKGVGNLKILKNPDTGKVRIFMRRDQVFKICANHFITKDMNLTPFPNNDKAYMWAAQDFSDGAISRETFSAKFKEAAEAKKFFQTFQDAKENLETSKRAPEKKTLEKSKESPNSSLGGFVFTGTPTFKPKDIKTAVPAVVEVQEPAKASPFSGFFFGKTDPKATALTFSPLVISNSEDRAASPVDDFVPTAEFKPVIPLPDLVDAKTGEENAVVLFEERTKLFRFDSSGEKNEWKERGVGVIKIIKDESVRLVMRRDQVHKVCCNHRIIKDLIFKANSKNPKAIIWKAQDFSDGVLKQEMFTARFKTEEIANKFLTTLQNVQKNLDDNNDVVVAVAERKSNFGNDFKPKPGSWECTSCLIRNEAGVVNCVACNAPKTAGFSFNFTANATDKSLEKNKAAAVSKIEGAGDAFKSKTTGFGDAFKPKIGSWECGSCMLMNEAHVSVCPACKTGNKSAERFEPNKAAVSSFKPKFGDDVTSSTKIEGAGDAFKSKTTGFGDAFKPKIGSWECGSCLLMNEAHASVCPACKTPKPGNGTPKAGEIAGFSFKRSFDTKINVGGGFGDQFKAKAGSWECKSCMVRNDESSQKCAACETPKDGGLIKQHVAVVDKEKPKPTEHKFVFGIPTTMPAMMSGEISITPIIKTLQTPPPSAEHTWTFGFKNPNLPSVPEKQKISLDNVSVSDANKNSFSFISPTKQEFEFTPKPPRRVSQGNDESDADASLVEEEEDNIYFKPVIPLPDKVEAKTGEEDEDVLYCHRAKLYRFVSSEWKERGLGDIKILRNKSNGNLRVVMRRAQVLKLCLNHSLTKNVDYIPKDEKSLMFAVPDFSEGKLVNEQFCVRFKTAEIAEEFKQAVDDALNGISTDKKVTPNNDNDDLEIIFETHVTPEEEERAISLGLPPKFMSYKQLPDCACDQCKKDDEYLKELFAVETPTAASTTPASKSVTFSQSTSSVVQSPKKEKEEEVSTSKGLSPLLKPSVLGTLNQTKTFSWSSTNLFGTEDSFKAGTKPSEVKSDKITDSNKSIFSFNGSKPFGGSPTVFGQKTASGQIPAATTASLFAQNSIFATPVTTSKIFGQNTPTNTTTSNIFGQNTPTTTSNIFGQNTLSTNISSEQNTPSSNVFGQNTPSTTSSSFFGPNTTSSTTLSKLFGQNTPAVTSSNPQNAPSTTSNKIFGQNTTSTTSSSIFGQNTLSTTSSNIVGQTTTSSNFVQSTPSTTSTKIFGQNTTSATSSNVVGQSVPSTTTTTTTPAKIFGQNTPSSSIFGQNTLSATPSSLFGQNTLSATPSSIFGQNTLSATPSSIFGQNTLSATSSSIFGQNTVSATPPSSNVLGQNTLSTTPSGIFEQNAPTATPPTFSQNAQLFDNKTAPGDEKEKTGFFFGKNTKGSSSVTSTTSDSKDAEDIVLKCDTNLSFASLATNTFEKSAFAKSDEKFSFFDVVVPVFETPKANTSKAESDDEDVDNKEFDPHYDPIVPLPDKVAVTTGEENEEVLFNQRAKLYRYDVDVKEWKERGVGQLKVLFHPVKGTYRLVQRREQVFKIVLNQLIPANMELQPMALSEKAWMWAGYNYTEDTNCFEKLAVRFKNQELANQFRDVIQEVVNKMSESVKDVPVTVQDFSIENNDNSTDENISNVVEDNGDISHYSYIEEEEDEEDEDLEEEEDERTVMFMKECTLSELKQDNKWHEVGKGSLQVYYDPEIYAARIVVIDDDIICRTNTLIAINTAMEINGNECVWKAVEWADDNHRWRTLRAQFEDESEAQELHSNYLESINYAQQIGLVDEIPLDS